MLAGEFVFPKPEWARPPASTGGLRLFMSNKISLCMIVGNVSEYIERCLNSFLPIADEVVIVRAIGNQTPDDTEAIARRVVAASGKPFVFGEYQNQPGHDWPHVDSFAAARQLSYDLASGEYCFWCDSDDVLKCGAERVRQLAESGEYACYVFPYEILGKGVTVPRERMMLRQSGKWKNAVHESFKFHVEPVTGAQDDGVVVLHMPHLTKTGSNDRNLRIMESMQDRDAGMNYHMFGELLGADRVQEAMALGTQLLTESDLGKHERYDILLTLCLNTDDIEQRKQLLHCAYATDPLRREALGTLACVSMDCGKYPEAMVYAKQMAATPVPHDECWNSRKSFYGYIGDEIYMQALRVNGRNADADKLREVFMHKYGRPRIALIHATRGRPQQAAKCRKRWFDLAEKPELIEHVFAIDEDDDESRVLARFHHVVAPKGSGCVGAWNRGALMCRADIYIQLSDDWTPVPHWDKLIWERLKDHINQPKVLAISDGHRKDQLLCMAIMTREYWARDWFMFHPDFTGVYSDNWFTHQAYQRGAVIEARDIVFTHDHPAFGKAPVDKTYIEQNAAHRYEQGLKVMEWLQTGKDWSSVPGFFNYWPYYEAIADELKDGDEVVEIGCWLGRSAIYLAQRLKRDGKRVKINVVDTFKGESNQLEHEATVRECGGSIRAAFEENIKRCGVADMFNIIEGDSAQSAAEFADKSLAFVWIDAAHDYESVKRDITAWKPKVKPDGILAGHDAQWHEVERAVKELIPKPKFIGVIWEA